MVRKVRGVDVVPALVWLLVATIPAEECARAHESGQAENAALQYWMALQFVPTVFGDEWRALVHDPIHAPLKEVKGLLTEWNRRNIIEPVHRGAKMRDCDWQLPANGPATLIWQAQKSREIVSFIIVDARHLLSLGRQTAAIDELCDGLVFIRHVATDGSIGSSNTSQFYELMLVQVLAHQVPQLNENATQLLATKLDALPERLPLAQRVAKQRKADLAWFRSKVIGKESIQEVLLQSELLEDADEATNKALRLSLAEISEQEV